MTDHTHTAIELQKLAHHPQNVRKVAANEEANIELRASIHAHGLLENLVVTKDPDADRYLVVAGGRRLNALHRLQAEGLWPEDRLVSCLLLAAGADPIQISLAENSARAALSTADEIEAFAALAVSGITNKEIADRFGYAPRIVAQRIKLGTTHPELRRLYGAGNLSYDALCAFATVDGKKEQMAVYKGIHDRRNDETIPSWDRQRGQIGGWEVRQVLEKSRGRGDSKAAEYVGVEAYQAAGGRLETDLFGQKDRIYLLDQDLIERMAREKMAEHVRETGLAKEWAWVDTMLDFTWQNREKYIEANKTPARKTAEEKETLAKLKTDIAAAVEAKDRKRIRELRTERDNLEHAIRQRASWSAKVKKTAGCVVHLGYSGNVRVAEGLWRPEDASAHRQRTDPKKVKKKPNPYRLSNATMDTLREIRLNTVRAALSSDLARQLLEYELVMQVFGTGLRSPSLDLRFVGERAGYNRGVLQDVDHEQLQARVAKLPLKWLKVTNTWEEWLTLSDTDRAELVTVAVAALMYGQLSTDQGGLRTEFETVAHLLDIDWPNAARPNADLFWSKMTKGELLKVARSLFGKKWVGERKTWKKADLVSAIDSEFRNDATQKRGPRKKVQAFTLPGFIPKP